MEEKLKRLKEFNSKPKQPSQRSECKWCKEEILKGSSICPSCQQPQKKRHWLLAHPSVAVSVISLAIAFGSFRVAWEANNPPPATPELGAQHLEYSDKAFKFAAFNYGNAPTYLTTVMLKITLEKNKKPTHQGYIYYELDEPVFLPVGSKPETLTISYTSPFPDWTMWTTIDQQDAFTLLDLHKAATFGSGLSCEISLWYSVSGTASNRETAESKSTGGCLRTMEWMASTFGPLQDMPPSDLPTLSEIFRRSPDT